MKRAPHGATVEEIAALEARLGRRLPASYARFLEAHGWFETRSLRTLAVESIEATMMAVQRFVDTTLATPWKPEVVARGHALRAWIPLADFGDTLPLGTGIFLDEDGDLRIAIVREFPFEPPGPKETIDIEALLVELLAERFDDDE